MSRTSARPSSRGVSRRSLILGGSSLAGVAAVGGLTGIGGLVPAFAASAKNGLWCNPTRGITVNGGEYGAPRGSLKHAGRDLATSTGTSIFAAASGKVVKNGYGNVLSGRNGWGLLIQHAGGYWTYYGHMKAQSPCAVGSSVKVGERIGYVGNTGLGRPNPTSGAHLHFETHAGRINGITEPYSFMAARGVVLGGDKATGGPGHGWSYVADGQSAVGVSTVKSIQYLLNNRGSSLEVDGNMGSKSGAAVKAFQKKSGLVQDGDCGPKTWAKLVSTAKQGASGNEVKALQQALVKHSHRMSVDGDFGSLTTKGVKSFQSGIRLVSDGEVGPITWQALVG
ncbi:MAG: peptidoglycan-binding protein [Nocardioides sp.]|nr:peptidoglycan-binding protein [Nocardioides sp.]